ncbi:MAG: pyridoxal-phosphate dependent enzyme [Burkholderiales bacterium]|jgi:threonine synthase|nr:pyridoxal-phosphate dependent enzyme [Burkholderiales bacterium]
MRESTHLTCIRCGKRFALADHVRGCDACAAQGVAANLTVGYDAPWPALRPEGLPRGPHSMWRYADLLHAPADAAVSLGEGLTPLLDMPRLGLGPLWFKDESRNPTWSFKDRLASAAVTMARRMGARVIACSSSGNAGAATAAYAARAGLPCVVLTTENAGGAMVTQMQAYGALLLKVPTSADRWTVLVEAVARHGWFPTTAYFGPVIGSSPLGIEGYKTIAYEIAEAMDWDVPEWCAVPACYGDSLYGIWKGFDDLRALGWTRRMPRLLAAEVSGSITGAMAEGGDVPPVRPLAAPSSAASIAAAQGTLQGLMALRASRGVSVHVPDEDILRWHARLGPAEGVYAEPASVATLPAIERLRADGTIAPHDRVVSLLTASGLKDNPVAERHLPPVPRTAPRLDAALATLKEHYGFDVA